jgi:hypothetical protein
VGCSKFFMYSSHGEFHEYSVEDFEKKKKRKNDVTLRRDYTIFIKVIIAPTLNEFCFRVKAIHFQDTTKSPITESKFR